VFVQCDAMAFAHCRRRTETETETAGYDRAECLSNACRVSQSVYVCPCCADVLPSWMCRARHETCVPVTVRCESILPSPLALSHTRAQFH